MYYKIVLLKDIEKEYMLKRYKKTTWTNNIKKTLKTNAYNFNSYQLVYS